MKRKNGKRFAYFELNARLYSDVEKHSGINGFSGARCYFFLVGEEGGVRL